MVGATEEKYNIRCVRESKENTDTPKPADFTRNDGVVTDNNTGFQWQDDYSDNNGVIKKASWMEAIDYCNSLSLNGEGWRLPNMNEVLSLVDDTKYMPSTNDIFQNIKNITLHNDTTTSDSLEYWTSSTNLQSGHYKKLPRKKVDSLKDGIISGLKS
ncbi:MAG: DUF1566 domain-containing protein [Methylococcaceae bacterium]|nr:DUF1566 domain-containing protein [Methylococcaceae bacterium]